MPCIVTYLFSFLFSNDFIIIIIFLNHFMYMLCMYREYFILIEIPELTPLR